MYRQGKMFERVLFLSATMRLSMYFLSWVFQRNTRVNERVRDTEPASDRKQTNNFYTFMICRTNAQIFDSHALIAFSLKSRRFVNNKSFFDFQRQLHAGTISALCEQQKCINVILLKLQYHQQQHCHHITCTSVKSIRLTLFAEPFRVS